MPDLFIVIVQTLEVPAASVDGLHCREARANGSNRFSEVVWELEPSAAVTIAVCPAVTAAAAALKVAMEAPAGTVTDIGTARFELLSLSATAVLEAAAWFKVTVQVELAGVLRDAGLQLKPLTPTGKAPVTVIVPPIPVVGKAAPANEAASVPVTEIEVLLVTVGERVTVTVATTPSGIIYGLTPVSKQS